MPSRSSARSILLVVSGICLENASSGGWGFVGCLPTGVEREGSGACLEETTADRMKMFAAVEGFRSLVKGERAAPLRVVSSSRYLVEGATGKRERIGNADLWAGLDALVKGRTVAWEWEPPNTMYFQTQASELAQHALRRALKGSADSKEGDP